MLVPLAFLLMSCCASFYWPDAPKSISDVMNLDPTTTWIRGRALPDEAIPSLSRIKGARFLDFEGGQASCNLKLTDDGLAMLADVNLPDAIVLSICYCKHITDVGLASIAKMNNIEAVGLRACYGITDSGMKDLATMNNLSAIDIRGCPQITNDSLLYLSKGKSLERLELGRLPINEYTDEIEMVNGLNFDLGNQISNEGFKYLANSKSLKYLSLSKLSSYQIDNRCLQYLSEAPSLEEINFYEMPFLDTNSMALLAKFKNLKTLTISAEKCPNLTDDGLKALSESRTIEKLTIYINDKITFDGISCLKNIGTLKAIEIGYIKGVTKSLAKKQLHEFHQTLPLCSISIMNERYEYVYDEYSQSTN